MLNQGPNETQKKRRRQLGPIIVAVLFLIAACGISADFFANQFVSDATDAATNVATDMANGAVGAVGAVGTAAGHVAQNIAREGLATTPNRDPAGDVDRSKLPFAEPIPGYPDRRDRKTGTAISEDMSQSDLAIVRDRRPAQQDISIETKEEDYRLSLAPSKWKGAPQLLPIPMFVSQLRDKSGRSPSAASDIRGKGWMAVDIAKSEIIPVELFRGKQKPGGGQPQIEAKRLDGSEIVSSSNTGFPIVRGVPDLRAGRFEVFENPPCMVRFGGVVDEEACDITLRHSRIRYKFEPPVVPEGTERSEFAMSIVLVDVGRDRWKKIGSFNENFYPIGDANRDGYPDFYAESVTGPNETGVQTLLISREHDETIDYIPYSTSFRSAR